MKFKQIVIENFLAIGSAKIDLADRGLTLIQGENNVETSATSNGAGKSSIADALSWCLFGTTARGESGDDVVNADAGKDCRVEVRIEDGTEVYVIARHRKHKKCKNGLFVWKHDPAAPGTPGKDLTQGTDKLTQATVQQIIGCSAEVFNGAVYAGQERMPDLPGMTDKQLKMLIEEASGATLLEVAYKEANSRLQAAKAALSTAETRVAHRTDDLAAANKQLADTEDSRTAFEHTRLGEMKTMAEAGKKLKVEIETIEADLAKLDAADFITRQIGYTDAKIAAVSDEVEQDRENTKLVEKCSSTLKLRELELLNAEKALSREVKRRNDLDHQVGCPCTTCNRPYSAEDIAPAKEIADKEILDLNAQRTAAIAARDAAQNALQSAESARDAYRATMTDLSAINAQRASLQATLATVRGIERARDAKKTEFVALLKRLKEKKEAKNPFTSLIDKAKQRIEDAEDKIEGAINERNQAIVDQKIADHVAKVFSPTGVRAFLLDDVTPFLNDQTAKYLGTLSDGHITATWTTLVKNAKGELREKFSIEVENSTGGKSFGLISGGEKRKVRIACALALQDLVARRASKPIDLFVGDEIDDALDPAGLERLVQILEEKARERGTVFIISHSDLKDWVRNTITVKKDGPRSTVEETVS